MTGSPSDARGIREVATHFDSISSTYYGIVDVNPAGLSYYHRAELEASAGWVGRHRPERILDAGCGPGRHTLLLAGRGGNVVSLDLSLNMLSELRRATESASKIRKPNLVHGDVRRLPFASRSFDFIVCAEVLQHLPSAVEDGAALFSELSRVLRPGGGLMLEFPLIPHSGFRLLPWSTVPWKSIAKPELERIAHPPLRFHHRFWLSKIERMTRAVGLSRENRIFVRVLPSGFVHRAPSLAKADAILEKLPLARLFAFEVILFLRKTPRGNRPRGPVQTQDSTGPAHDG